jgi:FMN phosphatase YigB (HAD superfamily)
MGVTQEGVAMNKAVLVDIDGTLVGITPNWSMDRDAEWVEETLKAEVYTDAVEMLHQYKKEGYKLVVVTARGQSCKANTWKKFREMGIDTLVDSVWHRPVAWEGKDSASYKEEMIKRLSKKYNFVWAMEDEDRNKEVMTAAGMQIWHGEGK